MGAFKEILLSSDEDLTSFYNEWKAKLENAHDPEERKYIKTLVRTAKEELDNRKEDKAKKAAENPTPIETENKSSTRAGDLDRQMEELRAEYDRLPDYYTPRQYQITKELEDLLAERSRLVDEPVKE